VREDAPAVDAAALASFLDPSAGFPSPELIGAAAACFLEVAPGRRRGFASPSLLDLVGSAPHYRQLPDAVTAPSLRLGLTDGVSDGDVREEGRDFVLAVSGGVVSLRLVDHERRRRTEAVERSREGLVTLTDEAVRVQGLRGRLTVDGGGAEWTEPDPTRVVTEWSRKSRANMTRALSELDYRPLFAEGRPPAMVTVTYPGEWLVVAPSGAVVKKHLRALWKRYARVWGRPWIGPWKLEFQDRGAPHFHMFMVPPVGTVPAPFAGTLAGTGPVAAGDPVNFTQWLSMAWAAVVGHPDPEQFRRHLLAGTGVDWKEGARGTDPKRLAVYFTKHGGAAGGKEYQHRVPEQWQTPTTGPGRFWGYTGLERATAEVYVNQQTYVRVRRTLRRLAQSRRLTSTWTLDRGAPVVNVDTGEVRRRRRTVTRRRRVPMRAGGMSGGFLLTNDGPALATKLAGGPGALDGLTVGEKLRLCLMVPAVTDGSSPSVTRSGDTACNGWRVPSVT
jgi:hypothetical protein